MSSEMEDNGLGAEGDEQLNHDQGRLLKEKEDLQEPEEEVESYDERLKESDRIQKAIRRNQQREAELRMQAELEEHNVTLAPRSTASLPPPPLLPLISPQNFPEEDAKTREERKKERDRIRKERDRLRKREIRANMDPLENERRKEKDRIRARLRRAKRDSLPVAPVQISSAPGPKSKKAIATIPPNVIPGETYGERRRRLERERKREVRAKAKIHALIQQTLQQSDQTAVQKPRVTEALTKRIKRVIDGMMTTVDEKNFAEEIPHYRHVKKKLKKTQCAAGVPNKYKELPLTLREEEQCAFMEMTLQQLKVEFEERKRRVFEEALDIEVGGQQQSEQHNNNHNENNPTIDQQHLEAQYQAIQSQITTQQETMQFDSSETIPSDIRVEGEVDSTKIQEVAVQVAQGLSGTSKELVEGEGEKIPEGWKDMLANEEEEDDGHLDIPRMFQTANVKVELVEPDYNLQELNPADNDKHWKTKTSLQSDRMQRRSKYRAESKIREFAEDEDNEDMQDLEEYDSDVEARRKHRQKVVTSQLVYQKQQQQRREHIAVMGRLETQLRDLKCKWEKLRICWINIAPYSIERNELDKERRILLKKIRTEKEELYRLLVEYVKEKREKGKFLDDTEETSETNANGVSTIATNSANKSIRSIALARREHAKLIRKQRERNEDRKNLTNEEQRQKRNAKAKLRKEMERIEYDIYNEVEAVIFTQTLDFPTLQKFEETFYKIPNQTAIDYWYNYLAAPKTRNELLEWRARVWEIMNKRRVESGTVPEGAAQPVYTPIPVTTEQSQIDFNNLKNLIETSGNIIKDHLNYKRFYIYNSQKRRLEKKKQNQTEEEKIEQQNKLNAYLRKKYWKKKGVNIEFGAYVQPNIAKGMYNKKHGINEKIRGPRKPRKSKNHNETLQTDGFKRKRRPGGGRKPKEPKLPQSGHSSQNNSYTPSSSAGIQYAGHPSNEAFSASFDNSNDDSGDGGWMPFQIPTGDSYYLDLDHQNYQNQHLQNSQQSQYHSQQQGGGVGQGHHNSQHAPRLQLVNQGGHFSQQVHGQHWTQAAAAGDMHAVQFLPNSQINLIGHIAAAAASSAAASHHHNHHHSQYYTNQDYSSSASSVIEHHHQRSHKKRGRVRGKKYNFKKTLDGVKNFARKREGIWQRKKRAPDGTEDAIAAFIETPAPLEKLIDKEMLLPKCTICDKVLSNDIMLQKHYKRWHAKDEKNRKNENGKTRASPNKKTSSPADPENDNKCIICNYKYMDIRTYTSHLKNMHFTKEGKDNMHPCPFGRRQKLPCGQREFGRKFIKEHMKKHHGKDLAESFVLKVHSAKEAKKSKARKYLCLHCESDFLYYSDLVRHYGEAHGRKRYECQFCGIYLRTDDFFWDHVKLFHPETKCSIIPPAKNLEPSSAFRCTECFSEFSSNNHLTLHMEKGHKFPNANKTKINNDSDDENTEATDEFCYIDTPYKCEICKHRYTELFNLRYHAVRDHGLYDYIKSAKEQGLLEETNLAAEKSDVSTPISYQLAMPTRYSRTSRKPKPNAMENTPSIPCTMCQAKITGTECHDYHKRYEKYIKRYCIPCNRMFCRAEILDKHNEQCHGISPDSVQSLSGTDYRCPVCLSPFSTIEFHRHHALFEDDPDNKRCEICGQNFVNRQAHSKHMREDHKIPAKESQKRKRDSIPKKQLVPEDCENLVVETKVETGGASGEMTLFTCKICQKNFKTKDFAKFHVLFAHKEDAFTRALCKQCNATFVDARTLRKHIQVHHGELRRIICPFCDKPFSSRMQGFRLHLSNVHPGLTYKPEELRIITGTTQDEIFCKLCSKFFKTEQGLKEHMTGKHFSAHFSTFCELCGLQLNPLYKFKHMRYHAEAEQQAAEETEAAISTIESEAGASSSTTPRRINAQSAKFDVTQLIDVMHYIITTSAKRLPPPRTRYSNGRRGERSIGRRVTYRELSSGESGDDYEQSDYEDEDVDYYSDDYDESLGDLIITPEGTKSRPRPGPYSKTRGVRKVPEAKPKAKRKLVIDKDSGPSIPYIDLDYDRRLVLELKRCDKAAAKYAALRRARIKKERDMKKKKAEQKRKELERKERLLKKKREIERKREEEEKVELAFAAEVGNYFAIQGQAEVEEEVEEPAPQIPIAPIPVSVIQPLNAATWDQNGFPVNIKTEPDDDFHVFAVECDVEVDPLEPSTSAAIPMEN